MTKSGTVIDRKGFLKRAVVGVAAAGVGVAAKDAAPARADTSTDPQYTGAVSPYTSPFAPYPTMVLPGGWNVYTGLTPVVIPAGVFFSSVPLAPIGEVNGLPDLRQVPTNTTLLCVYHEEMPSTWQSNGMPSLNAAPMSFAALGGGAVDPGKANFRKFLGAWTATVADALYLIQVFLYIGPTAGPEWAGAQTIVDSIALPA